jgi:repressor LexA
MKTPDKTLGERIRELREQQDFSVRELARKLKVSAPFLSDVELGRRHPSDDVLEKLARELKTTPDELKWFDARPAVQELKRIAATNRVMGFALRKVVDQRITAEELLHLLERHERDKKK